MPFREVFEPSCDCIGDDFSAASPWLCLVPVPDSILVQPFLYLLCRCRYSVFVKHPAPVVSVLVLLAGLLLLLRLPNVAK
jgi:hypothetical protein